MVPKNLTLTASRESNKLPRLVELLRLPQFDGPVIVYCSRQFHTEQVRVSVPVLHCTQYII
jgi:hypothetical protein